MTLRIAIIQMDIAFGQPQQNFEHAKNKIEEAVSQHPDVIVLPELWTTGYDLENLDKTADVDGKEARLFLSSLAKEHHVNIVGGSVAKRLEDGVTNTLYTFNREGELVGEYSKVHLFRLMDEEKFLQAGEKKGLFDIDGHLSAGVICYDIRFPEWIRTHVLSGANVLYVSAEWPTPRLAHWRTLLIARAIENQCYVVACNRVGSDPNNTFAGHSLIIDPWGEVVAEGGEHEEIVTGEIDIDNVKQIRSRIPIFEDRRPTLY